MKKVICLLIAALLLCTSAYAAPLSGIVYTKSDEAYNYGSETVSVAVNSESGDIVPLSIAPYDGYTYAYLPEGGSIKIYEASPTVFSDVDEYDLYVNELSARGILTGDGNGNFLPQKELTRAETAAIFARLFSVNASDEEPVFSDTAADSWYTGYVTALCGYGVFSKDDKFNPDSIVTREQLTAMTYRMLSKIGCIDENAEYELKHTDFNLVSDFAKKPYTVLKANGYMLIEYDLENDPMDMSDDIYELAPQKAVTRYECASFLYYIIRDFFLKNAPAIRRDTAPKEEIPILDGSTSTYAITQNIYNSYYVNSGNNENMPKAHSKTSNSYKRLIDGEVEMIFVPDPSEEIKSYAEQKGVKLKYVPIANEALVFFTASDNPAGNITTQQLRDIYVDNKIQNWKDIGGNDAYLAAYCRNNDSGSHAQMEKFILEGNEINGEISKERISYIMSSILTDVDSYNKENSGSFALGYSLYYYYQTAQMLLGPLDLKLMSIDGAEASDETIGNGTYPYTTNYYAVVRDEENERVEGFIELLQTDFGNEIIAASGLGVIKK